MNSFVGEGVVQIIAERNDEILLFLFYTYPADAYPLLKMLTRVSASYLHHYPTIANTPHHPSPTSEQPPGALSCPGLLPWPLASLTTHFAFWASDMAAVVTRGRLPDHTGAPASPNSQTSVSSGMQTKVTLAGVTLDVCVRGD